MATGRDPCGDWTDAQYDGLLTGPLRTARLSSGHRHLCHALGIEVDGMALVVPETFVTDYSSIPWYGRFLVRWSRVDIAGVVHDWLYNAGPEVTGVNRRAADRVWRLIARRGDHAASWIQAWTAWAMLRFFGGWAWASYRRCGKAYALAALWSSIPILVIASGWWLWRR